VSTTLPRFPQILPVLGDRAERSQLVGPAASQPCCDPGQSLSVHTNATAVPFNQLHVKLRSAHPAPETLSAHGPVEAAEIVRGYQFAPDQLRRGRTRRTRQVRRPRTRLWFWSSLFPFTKSIPSSLPGGALSASRRFGRRGIHME